VQDRTPQRRGARDLRKLETQAETGIRIAKIGNCQNLPKLKFRAIFGNPGNFGNLQNQPGSLPKAGCNLVKA
jgi:hypothetical protein